LKYSAVGVQPSFLTSVGSDTRHSIAHTITQGATLTVEVSSNADEVLPLCLAPFYKGECKLTLATVPSPLRTAVFCDCPLLCDVLRYFVWFATLVELSKVSGHGLQQENEQIHRRHGSRRMNFCHSSASFAALQFSTIP
jgi:hypothetical protein